ncbi:MAG: hypothetical protein ABEH65_09700 [Halobacteriales archaeon]
MSERDDRREANGDEQIAQSLAEKFDLSQKPGVGLPLRERLRRRIGVSDRVWAFLVSVAFALPYPVFLYVFLETSFNGGLFILITLIYSLIAIYANSVL